MTEIALVTEAGETELLDQARTWIDRAVIRGDTEALEAIRTRAAGYQDYYTNRESARAAANAYGEIKVRAERGLGQIDSAENPASPGRPKMASSSEATFERRQWKPDVSSSTRAGWRKLGQLDDDTFEQHVANARNDQEQGVTTRRILEPKTSGPGAASKANQRLTPEWYTPVQYIDAARLVLGEIDLDPASSEAANETVKASQFYTEHDSGLDHPWAGRVWLNPPYGGTLGPLFVAKLIDEYRAGSVKAAITLLNSAAVTNRWFTPLWDYLPCFHYGRIHFGAGTDERTGPTHGNVFVYLGDDADRFDDVFAEFGVIVQRRRT